MNVACAIFSMRAIAACLMARSDCVWNGLDLPWQLQQLADEVIEILSSVDTRRGKNRKICLPLGITTKSDFVFTRPRPSTDISRKISLRCIAPSAELAARGFVAERTGRPYQAAQIARLLVEEK